MEADMSAYYESLGKSFADFKTVIPLDWMMGGAKILPKIVKKGDCAARSDASKILPS